MLPESIVHGVRCAVHIVANSVSGFFGSSATSFAPVRSLTLRHCSQVLPPSFVR